MFDLLYTLNSLIIAFGLFVAMTLAMEAGYRRGLARGGDEAKRVHVNGVQSSLLGALALMIGFTFSLALQRFDVRSEAVVIEANAIGTAWLRSAMLPDSIRDETRALWREYAALQVESAQVTMLERGRSQDLIEASNARLAQLWALAVRASEEAPDPVRTGLYIQALNDTIDALASGDAAVARHVPSEILWLMFATFVLTAGVIGYSAGMAGHRPAGITHILLGLFVVIAFVIIDLDRPRRGLIRVDHAPLVETLAAMKPSSGG